MPAVTTSTERSRAHRSRGVGVSYDRAYAAAVRRSAAWLREHQPEIWDELLARELTAQRPTPEPSPDEPRG